MKPAAVFLALVLAAAMPAGAHEIGKTQVTATFRPDGTYQIDILVDPDALLTKLEVYAGLPVSTGMARTERDRRIDALQRVFVERVSVRFDGGSVPPRFEYRPVVAFNDLAQVPSVVRLTGDIPKGAGVFTFSYGLAMGSYALNVRVDDSPLQTTWVEGAAPSAPASLVAPPPPLTPAEIAWQYFGLGFTHILPKGLDHILFVVGIFLLSTRCKSVLLQVSTFTVAHSITLGLTMYGLVSLPARVVEPMIAVSIAYVAVENLVTSELKPWRLALVFAFGLLHGMGFAGVLRDLGLPRADFLTALVTFNAGVEAGQLAVISAAFLLVGWYCSRSWYRNRVVLPTSASIACTALYWSIERTIGL